MNSSRDTVIPMNMTVIKGTNKNKFETAREKSRIMLTFTETSSWNSIKRWIKMILFKSTNIVRKIILTISRIKIWIELTKNTIIPIRKILKSFKKKLTGK